MAKIKTIFPTTEKAQEIKELLKANGIEANVKKGVGSMKWYFTIWLPKKRWSKGEHFTEAERLKMVEIFNSINGLNIFREPFTKDSIITMHSTTSLYLIEQ